MAMACASSPPLSRPSACIARRAAVSRSVAPPTAARQARAPAPTPPAARVARPPATRRLVIAASAAASGPASVSPPGGGALLEALATARALLFYAATLAIAAPLFVLMLALFPAVWLLDRDRRRAMHWVNNIWANLTTLLFFPIEVVGAENLPPASAAAVLVANHASFLDIYALFRLWRPFKFVSKPEIFYFPLVGWSMFLTGHVLLNRTDKRSQLAVLARCGELLKLGAPVLFFPEGTRSDDGKLADFKKGAFSVAVKAGVPVVPISLLNTGRLMPNHREGRLYPAGRIKIVVHPPLTGSDAEALMAQSQALIAADLDAEGESG